MARFSSDRCREVEAALIMSGRLDGTPSNLELSYPAGGVWHIATNSERAVIVVSTRQVDDSKWVLEIQPRPPLRPQVVYRNSPSASQFKQYEQLCYEVALVIEGALRPLCPELQWELETEAGALVSREPIPPLM